MPRDPATHVGAKVFIDDVEIPCDPDSLAPGVLSGLKVTWGRSGRLEKPAATTCDFELVDPDGGTGYQDVVGYDSEVKVSFVMPNGSLRLVFSGVVSDLEVTHDDVGDTIVKATCIDYTARLASINMGDAPWPQQSSQDRWAAIVAAIPEGIDVSVPNTVPFNLTMAAMDVDNQSVAEVVEDFAWGLGRIPWPITTLAEGSLTKLGAGYVFTRGNWFAPTTDGRDNRRQPTSGIGSNVVVSLDACDIDMDGTSFTGNPDDVPQPIRVTWGGNSEVTGTYVLDNVGSVQDTTRRFDVSSGVIQVSAPSVASQWYGQMAQWAPYFDAPWRGGALRLDPDTVTGIDQFHQAMRYLLDYVDRIDRTVLLQLLPPWTPWRDPATHAPEPNVLGRLQGGTYTFEDGRWLLDLNITVERALVGDLAPAVDVVVRPGDIVPYDHDTDSVILVADPSTTWPVAATARFNDGNYGWNGVAWVLGGVAAIYVSPGDAPGVAHDDIRVRPSPTTPWAPFSMAAFSDGNYQWSGTDWLAMVTVTQGSTIALPHTAPNLTPQPAAAWPANTYATFTDGNWRWSGLPATGWVEAAVVVVPGGVYDFPHTQPGILANPSAAWAPSGTGERRPYGYATFSDGLWSWRGTSAGWLQMTPVAPGDNLTVNATTPRLTDTGVPATAWASAEHATWTVGTSGVAWYWNGNGGWDRWTPTWNAVAAGVAWEDVPVGTSWTEWDGEA